MAIVAAPPTSSAPDPVDVIDAADLVDGDNDDDVNDDVNDNDGDDMDDDGVKEFHAFETASTLEPATVETAQLLAQEANEGLPSSPKKQKDIMDVTANNNISSMSKLSLSSITHEGGATTTTTNSLLADTTSTSTTTTMTTTGGGERSSSSHSLVDDDGKPISEQEQSQKDKNRFVTPKDFELLKVIGIGAFGKVLQVRNKTSGQVVAMKVISKRLLRRKAGYIENVQAERNILTRVSHYPFVVTMHCSFQTREKLFLIMDFLAGGELFLRMGREGIFLEKDAAFYLGEIILGVDHLHTKGVLHRDLKPENILLTIHGHVCLTDFGLAKDFGPNWTSSKEEEEGGRARTICGTQEYMSPEMLASQGYGRSSDYWSVGCIAYEMLNGLPPFSSKEGSKALFQKIMKEKVKMPPGSSAAACKLLKGLLNRNVQARMGTARSTMFEVGGVSGLKKAEFFAKIDWEKLELQELVPPYKLTVDNEQDLRNFHDEFVQMSLPRSVMDISTSSALPRRCASDAFRGFSFIMEDFQLPDRNANDVEQYWNAQAEEDGESVSEAASSKCGFHVNDNNHNSLNRIVDDNAAEAESTDADQKKRPPRKRKKKDKVGGGAASQSVATASVASQTPTPSEAGDPPSTPAAATTPTTMTVGAAINPATPVATSKPMEQPSPPSLGPSVPAQPVAAKTVPAAFGNNVRAAVFKQQQQPLNPKAETWQLATPGTGTQRTPWNTPTATTPQATPPRSATVQQNGWAKQQPQRQAIPQPAPPAHRAGGWGTPAPSPATPTTPSTSAPPGSWANRIQNSTPQPKSAAKTPSSTRAEPPQTPQMLRSEQWLSPPPQVPKPTSAPYHPQLSTSSVGSVNSTGEIPSPSSDWRHHSSPQVQRALQRNGTFGSMDSNGTPSLPSVNETPVKWPSLAGYPGQAQTTGGGAGPLRSPAAPVIGLVKQPALKGAWAAKSKP